MKITHKITMEMAIRGVTHRMDAVQCEGNTRCIEILLTENGKPWPIPETVSAAVAFQKPDGTKGLYDMLPNGEMAVNLSGNKALVVLAPQVLTAAGLVKLAVTLLDERLNQLATFPFVLCVAPNPAAGEVVSNDYYRYSTMEEVSAVVSQAVDAVQPLANEVSAIKTHISDYPFYPGATLRTVCSGVPTDLLPLQKAIKQLTLYGADPDKQYYICYFFNKYHEGVKGERFYFYIADENGVVCGNGLPTSYPNSGLVTVTLKASNNSGITGTLVGDFSETYGMDVGTNGANPETNYAVTGLSKMCVEGYLQRIGLVVEKDPVEKLYEDVQLVVPSIIPVVELHSVSLCPENALRNADGHKDADCFVNANAFYYGTGEAEGEVCYMPESGAASFDAGWTLKHGSKVLKTAQSRVTVVPLNAGDGVTMRVLALGDSTTESYCNNESAVFPKQLAENFARDYMSIRLVGTRGGDSYRHEGRSGWKAYDYLYNAFYNGADNAFWNPNTNAFDFGYYMTKNGFDAEGLDVVLLNLGLNDLYIKTPAATVTTYIQQIIDSIHAYDPGIAVIIRCPNVCTKWESGMQPGWRKLGRKDQILEYIQQLLQTYDNAAARESKIFINPGYLYVNPLWDMRYAEKPLSERNPMVVRYGTDMTHPSAIGYGKLADAAYNAIKYVQYLKDQEG